MTALKLENLNLISKKSEHTIILLGFQHVNCLHAITKQKQKKFKLLGYLAPSTSMPTTNNIKVTFKEIEEKQTGILGEHIYFQEEINN